MQRRDLGTHSSTEFRVQVGQRLVQQEDFRVTNQSTSQCDTLSLTAAHGLRLALQVVLDVEHLGCLHNTFLDLIFRHFAVS